MDAEVDVEEFKDDQGYDSDDMETNEDVAEEFKQYKWEVLRKPRNPEPEFNTVDYEPREGKRLIELVRESGLQIIVKIASIELTPEKPSFPPGGWHIEGMMNEHICGTSLYYFDSENVTTSSLSFRMQTDAYMNDSHNSSGHDVGQDEYHWMQAVYGANFGSGNGSPCLQNYGSVETKQGRLLAFPNVFHHRVSGFQLADPTKPGHRRFIALWLVDPTKRIISTANVPPQQMDWWAESILGSTKPAAQKETSSKLPAEIRLLLEERGYPSGTTKGDGRLPEELMEMVREHLTRDEKELPMSVDEAKKHRLALMKERSAFRETSQGSWHHHAYSFCEH